MDTHRLRLATMGLPSIHVLVRLVALAALGIQLISMLATAQLAGAVAPGPPHFERTWERVDRPVSELLVSRSWLWGPQANTEVVTEEYEESPGGMRDVQYFDKSRMEVNNPAGDPNSPWFVTNGLLVVELMTGQMQTGNNSFEDRAPAEINVAGDAADPNGPTYQTFASLRGLPPLADDAVITQRVDRDGNVTEDAALASYGATAAYHVQVPGIDHQVASPFWEFMNSTGLIYDESQDAFVEGDLFLSPFYATGLPLTEAYWAMVEVGGTPKEVLSQCFERRCLTFTPDNPEGWQVEAGNVGLHYYDWRYQAPPPPPPADGLPLINEVEFWPEDGELQWVELHNPGNEPAGLSGLRITNGAGDHVSNLPAVELPPGAYLVVYLGGDGQDDLDFSDNQGAYYDVDAPQDFFNIDFDEVALRTAGEGVDTFVDFFVWSYEDAYTPQGAFDDAVDAGIWSDGDFFDATRRNDVDFVHPVGQGETVGRDADSTDTNTSFDWAELGGPDALGATPGARNAHQIEPSPPPTPTPPTREDEDAVWTVMVFGEGRRDGDGSWKTYRAVMHEINKMERSGSNQDVNIVAQVAWNTGGGGTTAQRWHLTQDSNMSRLNSGELCAWSRGGFQPRRSAGALRLHYLG